MYLKFQFNRRYTQLYNQMNNFQILYITWFLIIHVTTRLTCIIIMTSKGAAQKDEGITSYNIQGTRQDRQLNNKRHSMLQIKQTDKQTDN